jgi:hypothetical protein
MNAIFAVAGGVATLIGVAQLLVEIMSLRQSRRRLDTVIVLCPHHTDQDQRRRGADPNHAERAA